MPNSKSLWLDAFKHLRLHFSFLLLPVFLFALSQSHEADLKHSIWIFGILHLLVYPASNAYNSYHDRDTGSIGGLQNPPPTNQYVLWIANLFDGVSVLLSFIFLNMPFALLLLGYIAMSRLYSNRKIRIKQYPILAFSTVFIFQGAYTFLFVFVGLEQPITATILYALLASSFQIGAVYPLTQIYQHKSDEEDGVISLSARLGYTGTFVFSGFCFALAITMYYLYFNQNQVQNHFFLLLAFQIPSIAFFNWWAIQVYKNPIAANFQNTMRMSVISAVAMNLCFLTMLLISKH